MLVDFFVEPLSGIAGDEVPEDASDHFGLIEFDRIVLAGKREPPTIDTNDYISLVNTVSKGGLGLGHYLLLP